MKQKPQAGHPPYLQISLPLDEMNPAPPPVALSIAGSDCSAGAGIQADLKTFLNHGVHGLSVVTCVVAETPREVRHIEQLTASSLAAQLEILTETYPIGAAKTGLLPSATSIRTIVEVLTDSAIKLVVDPVMIASTGTPLTGQKMLAAMTGQLLPLASLVTPNIPEAEALLERSIRSEAELEPAARDIAQRYGVSCLLKGGHLPGTTQRLDILWHRDEAHHFSHPYINTPHGIHGTGCTLSAAITAGLAQDKNMPDAVATGIAYVQSLIHSAHRWGEGDASIHCLGWQ